MMELAGREHDYTRYDSLATLLAKRRNTPPPFVARALLALGSGDAGRRAELLAEVRGPDAADAMPVWAVATFTEDLDAARRLALASLARAPRPRETALLHHALAGIELAAGRWPAGRAALAAAAASGERAGTPAIARTARRMPVMYAAIPFFAVDSSEWSGLRSTVDGWTTTTDSATAAQDLPAALQPHMRLYLLGLLDARRGAHDDAGRYADELAGATPVPGAEAVVRTLVRGVRATIAAQRGDAAGVLAALGPTNEVIPPIYAGEFSFTEVYARWLRAEALHALGRDDDALTWYALAVEAPVANGAMLELALTAPAHQRLAGIHERRGDKAKAAEHARRFQAMRK